MEKEINFNDYKPIIITFDGTSASGKGTIVRGLKKELGKKYKTLDAGLMYRALTYYLQNENYISYENLKNKHNLETFLNKNIKISINEKGLVILNNSIIDDNDLRGPLIDPFIAKYAQIDEVKLKMIQIQQQIISNSNCGWILDGRCMGTVVAPFAQAKFYMDAPILVRATRRHIDYIQSEKMQYSTEEIKIDLERRDKQDMQTKIAPLKKPEDSIEIDSYKRNPNQAIEIAFDYVTKKIIEEGKI